MLVETDDLENVGPLASLLSVHLRRVDVLLTRAVAAADTRSEAVVSLALIASNPGISQNQLARLIRQEASTIVGIVNQLEELGWAVRKPSSADRRKHALHATSLGEREIQRISAEIKKAEDTMLAHVAPDEIQFLRFLLAKVHTSCLKTMAALQERS